MIRLLFWCVVSHFFPIRALSKLGPESSNPTRGVLVPAGKIPNVYFNNNSCWLLKTGNSRPIKRERERDEHNEQMGVRAIGDDLRLLQQVCWDGLYVRTELTPSRSKPISPTIDCSPAFAIFQKKGSSVSKTFLYAHNVDPTPDGSPAAVWRSDVPPLGIRRNHLEGPPRFVGAQSIQARQTNYIIGILVRNWFSSFSLFFSFFV
jgi:hypothetical protein